MILDMLVSAFGQGFIYAPMALGVFISFGILKTPDLSVEGSFVFGMTASYVFETPSGASVVAADLIAFGFCSLFGRKG